MWEYDCLTFCLYGHVNHSVFSRFIALLRYIFRIKSTGGKQGGIAEIRAPQTGKKSQIDCKMIVIIGFWLPHNFHYSWGLGIGAQQSIWRKIGADFVKLLASGSENVWIDQRGRKYDFDELSKNEPKSFFKSRKRKAEKEFRPLTRVQRWLRGNFQVDFQTCLVSRFPK